MAQQVVVSVAASLQSQDNLMHILESEKYTPSQVHRALQTALDDSRSFHFDKIVRLARVECLATPEASSSPSSSSDDTAAAASAEAAAQRVLFFELLQVFASGDVGTYVARQEHFAPLMAEHPHRVDKLKAICVRRLQEALDDPDVFDLSEFLNLVEDPRCADFLAGAPAATAALALLDLLAFRTLADADAESGQQPLMLSEAHLHKLRKLSLSSLAGAQKTLTYATLQVSRRHGRGGWTCGRAYLRPSVRRGAKGKRVVRCFASI
jgi:hypothetical protein